MKISKLFHWLYAILMLLPFAFFVPSVLYYAFNDNATMQSVEVPKKETISVDFNQQCDFTYEITTDNDVRLVPYINNGNLLNHKLYFRTNYNFNSLQIWGSDNDFNNTWSILNSDAFNFGPPNRIINITKENIIVRNYPVSNYLTTYGEVMITLEVFDLTKMYGVGNEPTLDEFNRMFPNLYYPYTESELMQITYDTGETEQLVSNTDIINYAWESIWDLPLFNWCKVSFVSVPFTYITGLFGLAASNSFNYVFTYFASMSIIWLVFDVIMYVPLLVHRWLDKGIVE